MGMRLSVWCAEEFPFVSEKRIDEETFRYPEISGWSPAVFDGDVCRIWNVRPAGFTENQPVQSDIPVLFINGSLDYNTPMKWVADMLPNFSNSFHLIFNGWMHTPTTYWSNTCAMQAANDFFNDPKRLPRPDCLPDQVEWQLD